MYRKTYAEINLDNIKSNIKNIINHFDKYDYYFGVVKGNAYGHGSYVINALIESGINYLAVSTLEEALDVRVWNKDIPILLLQSISLEYIDICISNNITIMIHDYKYFKGLLEKEFNDKLKFHLKLDTGMNRLGLDEEHEVTEVYNKTKQHEHLIFEGIFTHMGTSGINDKNYDNQLAEFKRLTKNIPLDEIPIVHIDRSLTMMCHEKINFCNGVRLGISMFGYNQVPRLGTGVKAKLRNVKNMLYRRFNHISSSITDTNIKLMPALSLYSEIIQIKKVVKDEYVGYGLGFKAKDDIVVATISIGYADGLNLKNSGRSVIINNKRYPIIGSVNMGMISVKIDDTVKLNDIVTIIGEGISLREVSRYLNTTVYEVLCTIGKSVPRVYIENGKEVYIEECR
jgi:alanine racemase